MADLAFVGSQWTTSVYGLLVLFCDSAAFFFYHTLGRYRTFCLANVGASGSCCLSRSVKEEGCQISGSSPNSEVIS
ncbi:hypothetical protein BJX68DRAFT_227791 [Aspergillus pseudodeflectus]|uniref:Uncharacterized protein n=1 Tax=Aspergillus pseudodeflectus TaxID=176178 RepID=A0ABR4L6I8_9EURO